MPANKRLQTNHLKQNIQNNGIIIKDKYDKTRLLKKNRLAYTDVKKPIHIQHIQE